MQNQYRNVYNELYGLARLELFEKPRDAALEIIKIQIKIGAVKPEPCDICQDPDVEPHFVDYSHPLDILWFCKLHHKELHKHIAQDFLALIS